jgi:methylenetetrahydrofolate dehydrogenase (NADP+)/methenyltetrahydrofolate cyclohydrolase
MTARILDGKALGARLRAGLAARIATLPFKPGLRVVRVGEDLASGVYVRNKDRGRQKPASIAQPFICPSRPPKLICSRKSRG